MLNKYFIPGSYMVDSLNKVKKKDNQKAGPLFNFYKSPNHLATNLPVSVTKIDITFSVEFYSSVETRDN